VQRPNPAKNDNDRVDLRFFQKQQHPLFSIVLLAGQGFAPKMPAMKMIILVVARLVECSNLFQF
jgi:hypothetical protein